MRVKIQPELRVKPWRMQMYVAKMREGKKMKSSRIEIPPRELNFMFCSVLFCFFWVWLGGRWVSLQVP